MSDVSGRRTAAGYGRARALALTVLAVACLAAVLAAAAPARAAEHPYNRGCRLLAQDRYNAAARQFTKALEISPRDTDALNNLAVCNILLGKHALAQRQLEKALHLNPRYAGADLNIGGSDIIRERPEPALPPTLRAAEAEGGDSATWVRAAAQYNLGLIALLRGDAEAARAAFRRSAEIKRTPEAVLGAAVAACAAKDYDAAFASLEKAVKEGGRTGRIARTDLAAAHYKRGMEAFAAGDFEAARLDLKESQAARPTDAASIGLALVDAEDGGYGRAVSALEAVRDHSRSAEMRRIATVDLDRVVARADRATAWLKWSSVALCLGLSILLVVGLVRARRAPAWRRPRALLVTASIVLVPLTLAAGVLVFIDPLRTPQQLAVVVVLDAVAFFFLWRKRTA